MFDDTSYFVTVGLPNTVQLRLLGKVFSDVGTPRVSFALPDSALLLLSCSPSSFLSSFFFSWYRPGSVRLTKRVQATTNCRRQMRVLPLGDGSYQRFWGRPEDDTRDTGRVRISQDVWRDWKGGSGNRARGGGLSVSPSSTTTRPYRQARAGL